MHLQTTNDEETEEQDEGVLSGEGTEEEESLAALGDELIPHCGLEDEEIEQLNVPYDDRGPEDWVSAGTLDPTYEARAIRHGWRRLRYFPTWDAAEEWARKQFGDRFMRRVMDAYNSGCPYWAFLIRGPRGQETFN